MFTKPMFALLASLMLVTGVSPAHAQTPQPVFMTPEMVRTALKFPPPYRSRPVQVSENFRIGIMDACFDGLTEWLDANPQEKALTEIAGDSLEFMESSKRCTHGTDAYKVVRTLLPNNKIVIYKLYNLGLVPLAYDYFRQRGVHVVSLASGTDELSPDPTPGLLDYYDSWRKAAEEHQVVTFMAASNNGDKVHAFEIVDTNANRIVDISGLIGASATQEFIPITAEAGEAVDVYLWTERPSGQESLELIVTTADGVVAASAKSEERGFAQVRGLKGPGRFQVSIRNNGYAELSRAVMKIDGGYGYQQMVNGAASIPLFGRLPSPFFVVVGGFWMAADGRLFPSPNSPRSMDMDGNIIPHVMGPDLIDFNGLQLAGTSVAAPALAALIGPWLQGFDVRSVLNALGRHESLVEEYDPKWTELGIASSAWGVPEFERLFAGGTGAVLGKPFAEVVSVAIEGDDLVAVVNLDHCCVEGLSLRPFAAFAHQPTGPSGGWAFLRDEKDAFLMHMHEGHISDWGYLAQEPYTFRVPRKHFAGPGPFSLGVGISMPAYTGPAQQLLKVGDYTFSLN